MQRVARLATPLLRPLISALAAAFVVLATAAMPAVAAPTDAEVAALVSGKITGLQGVRDVTARADGQRLAFIAQVEHPERSSVDDALYLVGTDGSDLRLVTALGPGTSQYGQALADLQWSPGGRYVSFVHNGTVNPQQTLRVIDTVPAGLPIVATYPYALASVFVPDDRHLVVAVGDAAGTPQRLVLTDLYTGQEYTVGRDELPPGVAELIPAIPGFPVLPELPANAEGPAIPGLPSIPGLPGFDAGTTPSANGTDSAAPALPPLALISERIDGVPGASAKGRKLVLSSRAVFAKTGLKALRVKLAADGATRLRVYALRGRQIIGRASIAPTTESAALTVPIKRSARDTVRRGRSAKVTVRVVSTAADGAAGRAEQAITVRRKK